MVMGCLMTSDDAWEEEPGSSKIHAIGSWPDGLFPCVEGVENTALADARHCENGEVVARHLANHPAVAKVHWPGFEDHPGHDVAARRVPTSVAWWRSRWPTMTWKRPNGRRPTWVHIG